MTSRHKLKDSGAFYQEPIENIQLSPNDFQGNALLSFCSLLSTVTRYNGLCYSTLNLYVILFLNNNVLLDENVCIRLAMSLSHVYLIVFGIGIYFTEKESSYFFKQFVSNFNFKC